MAVPPEQPSEQYLEHHQRLLDGMADAVRAHGLRGSTVAEVVKAARVSRRTFYQHFDDLIDCYLELMNRLGDEILAEAREAATSGGTVEERIDRAVGGYLAKLDEDPALSRSYWQEYHLTGERGQGTAVARGQMTAELVHSLATEMRRADPALGPLPFEVSVMVSGSLRELVLHEFEHGRRPSESRAIVAWMMRLVAMADAPRDSAAD